MSKGIAWARATPEATVAARAAVRKAERRILRIGLSLLQELRVALRTVDGRMARRAVLVARQREVVERRRLRAQRARRERGVALETLVGDRRPGQLMRIRRPVRTVVRRAVACDAVDVGIVERSALLGVAGDAHRLAGPGLAHRVV